MILLITVDGYKLSIDVSFQAIDIAKGLNSELVELYVLSPDTRYDYLEDIVPADCHVL